MLSRPHERGDTLIEVLFAVTVFSLLIVGSLSIMNLGSATVQRSLEITLARQQIDAQAETLRFMNDAYLAVYRNGISFNTTDEPTSPAEEWYKMVNSDRMIASADPFNASDDETICPSSPNSSFVVNPRTALFEPSAASRRPATAYPQLVDNGDGTFISEGLWIQAVRSSDSPDALQSGVGYIDFHIRACWDSPGMSVPMRLGTIVRLYERR
jgi:type II secretory pathway pseudopilin PulG